MKPKIWNDITNILAKLASSKDYDPRVKYDTSLEYYGNQIPVLPKPNADDNGKSVVAKTDGTYELKKPAVTPADIIAATGEMTSQQAATTLDNIGGEPEKLIVTVTESGGVYSADKTFVEIEEAKNAGKTIEVVDSNHVFQLAIIDSGDEQGYFYNVEPDQDDADKVIVHTLIVNLDDEWVSAEQVYQCTPHAIVNLSSTSITIASAADNTIYAYGELTALTVTAITNPGEFSITFTSGATATVLTVPNSMIMPDGFAVEANTRYEINCKDGYAVVAGWAVSS